MVLIFVGILLNAREIFAIDNSDGGHFCKAVTVLFVHSTSACYPLKLHCRYLVICMRDVLMLSRSLTFAKKSVQTVSKRTENHPYVASSDTLFIVRRRRLERTGLMVTSETVAPQNSCLQAPDRNSRAVLSEKKPSSLQPRITTRSARARDLVSNPGYVV